jgi:hypothetical protein
MGPSQPNRIQLLALSNDGAARWHRASVGAAQELIRVGPQIDPYGRRDLKFGIMAPYMLGPVEDGEYAANFGRLAEEFGFESVWAVDHVVMCPDYESRYPYSPDGRSPQYLHWGGSRS